MLNELYTMYQGLKSIGEEPEIKHNDIQEPGKNNVTFRVMLDKRGQVSSVKLMTKEQIQDCWSLGNKQSQFPAVKVKWPLFADGHMDYLSWKAKNKRPKEADFRNLVKSMGHLYDAPVVYFGLWPGYREKILKRKKDLEEYPVCADVYELFQRYTQNATGVEILDQVARQVIASATEGASLVSLKAICALLFGEKLKNSGEVEDSKRITLLLDCRPQVDIDTYATSRQHVPALSRALFSKEEKNITKSNNGICALSGQNSQLVGDTFPEEKLAVLGPTILFAKNDGTSGKTVERYGQSRGKAFPVSMDLSQRLAAVISLMTSEKYKDVTWAKLPSSSLLLAYCRKDYDLPLTPLITGESEVEDFEDYQDAAESVLASFKGKNLSLDTAVDFVEIIKVDKANRKINFSTTAKVRQLINSVKNWEMACKNTPDFKLFSQVRRNIKKLCAPWGISPQQMISLSQRKYIRDGGEWTPLPGVIFADAMKLFLGKSRTVWIVECLCHITTQYQPLFRHCALSKVQSILPNKAVTVKTSPKNNAQALSAVTLIAVLLYEMGRTKEVYMNDFAFQLGQLCSAMDEVHIGYCASERGGSLPNTLLGNQVYGMALQDPVKAMAFMATRRRPYDSWVKRMRFSREFSNDKAKKNAAGEASTKAIKNATYAQFWMEQQAEKLNKYLQVSGIVTSDSYKAEVMLGYLAGRPFEQKKDLEKSNNDKGENQ